MVKIFLKDNFKETLTIQKTLPAVLRFNVKVEGSFNYGVRLPQRIIAKPGVQISPKSGVVLIDKETQ